MSLESDIIIENIIRKINNKNLINERRGRYFDDYTTGDDGFVWDNNANGDEEARRHMWYQAWHDPEEEAIHDEIRKAEISAKRAATVKARQEAEAAAFLDEDEIPEIIAEFVNTCVDNAGIDVSIDPVLSNTIQPKVINRWIDLATNSVANDYDLPLSLVKRKIVKKAGDKMYSVMKKLHRELIDARTFDTEFFKKAQACRLMMQYLYNIGVTESPNSTALMNKLNKVKKYR